MSTEFLTLQEAAEVARVPRNSLRYWISIGKLKAYRPGRHALVKRSELIEFIESCATKVAQ